MDFGLLIQNLLSPPILFFALGMAATLLRSDLDLPAAVTRALSIYLLMAIGIHGGVELAGTGISGQVALTLVVAVTASALFPFVSYAILRRWLDPANAAAIAACYGSVSVVTFVTAAGFLDRAEIAYSGFMVAAVALMESPAIVTGVLLGRRGMMKLEASEARGAAGGGAPDAPRAGSSAAAKHSSGGRSVLHEALTNGAVVLLVGSLLIGLATGERGWLSIKPFVKDPFQGLLCLFLLDMGLMAAKRLRDLRRSGLPLLIFALVTPVAQATLGALCAALLGLSRGDGMLLAVLFGSASYIAVPAAVRIALPRANPSLFVPMALAVTFPLNITIGMPLYLMMASSWCNP
ncbi:MAG: sodium-dependent bicarbonate transport family permease [Phycisphaeraceae bacterium]|nr:sodium-dependent bicarbonate transport family permease [Phycisphaeraceae bacterium]